MTTFLDRVVKPLWRFFIGAAAVFAGAAVAAMHGWRQRMDNAAAVASRSCGKAQSQWMAG